MISKGLAVYALPLLFFCFCNEDSTHIYFTNLKSAILKKKKKNFDEFISERKLLLWKENHDVAGFTYNKCGRYLQPQEWDHHDKNSKLNKLQNENPLQKAGQKGYTHIYRNKIVCFCFNNMYVQENYQKFAKLLSVIIIMKHVFYLKWSLKNYTEISKKPSIASVYILIHCYGQEDEVFCQFF